MVQRSKNVTLTLFYCINWDTSVMCGYPGAPARLIFLRVSVLPFYTLLLPVPLCICVADVWISVEIWPEAF